MCGIVGYITLTDKTRISAKDKFFTEALYMNALRGFHSTGIMSLREDFLWSYIKQAVPAATFIGTKAYIDRPMETWCAVGHNRHATKGEISNDNAHPFKHGPITLVHNGTLHTVFDLKNDKNYAVDSEVIAYNLSLVEPDKADILIGKLRGAYALVWFDERDESINMVRNSDRPLHVGVNRTGDILYFMSEGYMLNCVSERLLDPSARPSSIWQIATNQILKYTKGKMVPEVTAVVPFIRPITPQTWAHWEQQPTGHGGYNDRIPKTMINGERVTIPTAMKEMLTEWYNIDLLSMYCFRPIRWRPYGLLANVGDMLGRMYHPDWGVWFDCIVTQVSKTQATSYKSSWTVVINAIDYRNHGLESETTFVGRAQWFTWNQSLPTPDDWGTGPTKNDADFQLVCGPHGDITAEAFVKLCEAGCVMCTDNIPIADNDSVTWVGEMKNQPLCYECLDWHTQGGTEDVNTDRTV